LSEINVVENRALTVLEMESLLKMLKKPVEYYQKATYVQQQKICKILLLNIVVDNKKRLTLRVKP